MPSSFFLSRLCGQKPFAAGVQRFLAGLGFCVLALSPLSVQAQTGERIKDLATIAGVRSNQLAGYGLVVGLDGSGDQTTQTPFTVQSILNMLGNMGVSLPPGTNLQLKNVAAVMVTAELPAFARPGQRIDLTVSSIGNAKSLRGGTLVMTPLKGVDGQIYAMGQGNVLVGGAGAQAAGAGIQINHLAAGRVPSGATVERAVPAVLGEGEFVMLELKETDFGTARKMVEAIDKGIGAGRAQALDGRTIQVRAPSDPNARVAFLGQLESVEVTPSRPSARVVVNSRTGSVVMNQAVTLQNVAVAHGNLTVTVNTEPQVSQPNPLAQGETVVTQTGQVSLEQEPGILFNVPASANLADVVKALNALGANPLDLVNILQAMKAAGALRAELEII
jgi:flagellar P-ring protein FlgI